MHFKKKKNHGCSKVGFAHWQPFEQTHEHTNNQPTKQTNKQTNDHTCMHACKASNKETTKMKRRKKNAAHLLTVAEVAQENTRRSGPHAGSLRGAWLSERTAHK